MSARGRHKRRRHGSTPTLLLAVIAGIGTVAVLFSTLRAAPHGLRTSPSSTLTTNATHPSTLPDHRGTGIEAAISRLIQHRVGEVRLAVENLRSGQVWTLGDGAAQFEASVVKLDILEALLVQRPWRGGLSAPSARLASRMIEFSDNEAATALWLAVGGTTGVDRYNRLAGLHQTTASTCLECAGFPWPGWGLSTTAPSDQLRLLELLVLPNPLLDRSQRRFALGLMEHVTSDQAWGVSAGVPAGVTVALKNGWLPLNNAETDWQVNSVGWIEGRGRDYLIAVMTTGDPSEQYGIETIDKISAVCWQAL